MTPSTINPQPPYRRPRPLSAIQTLLWLVAGIAGMFALVSTIFAVKLGLEGRLPFSDAPRAAAAATPPAAPQPPVQAAPSATPLPAASPTAQAPAGFVSGAESILPSEVAHLAKHVSPLDAPPTATEPPSAPSISTQPPTQPPTPAAAPVAATVEAIPATHPADHKRVEAALLAWAKAWSSKDVDTYLAHYADTFTPASQLSRSAWAEQRRQRIARPGDIAVALDAIAIQTEGDKASARFTQHYRAGKLKLTEAKTIELIRHGDTWLIVQERLGH